jgi:hypothetical protein
MIRYSNMVQLIGIPLLAALAACGADETGPPQGDGNGPPDDTTHVTVIRPDPTEAIITVAPGVTHQTIVGWEGVAYIGQGIDSPIRTDLPTFAAAATDSLVNGLGITSLRLHINASAESDADYYLLGEQQNKNIIYRGAQPKPTGMYFFTDIQRAMDWVVMPMKALIEANGETLNLRLVFHGNNENPAPGTYSVSNTADGRQRGANTILEAYKWMWGRYGLIPDEVDVVNEPDLSQWNTAEFADFAYKIAKTLEANASQFGKGAGWKPALTVPGVSNVSSVGAWFNACWNYDPTGNGSYPLRPYIKHIGYHLYDATRPAWAWTQVEQRRAATGVLAYMTEYTGLTYTIVHDALRNTNASLVDRLAMAGRSVGDDSINGDYFRVTDGTGSLPRGTVFWANTGKLLRNYFRYIRPGAVRKGTTHQNSGFADGLAFINPNGRWVVVVKTTAQGPFWVDGLPEGTYGINYGLGTDSDLHDTRNHTLVQAWNVDLPDVTITAGSAIRVVSGGTGVYTIYQKQ